MADMKEKVQRYGMFLTFLALLAVCLVPAKGWAQPPSMNKICEQLENYNEAGANFVPGVDARGNPVPPADLGNSALSIYDPVIIPISVDIGNRAVAGNKPEVAWLEIYSDGRVLFNGEDIGPDIRTRCPLTGPLFPAEQDGQTNADPLVSGDNMSQQGSNGDAQP